MIPAVSTVSAGATALQGAGSASSTAAAAGPRPFAPFAPFEGAAQSAGTRAVQFPAIVLNAPPAAEAYQPSNWGEMARQMVRDVGTRQAAAGELVRDVLAGGATSPHQALVAMEEASVSFQLLAEMRNKFVESYQEVMRMQV